MYFSQLPSLLVLAFLFAFSLAFVGKKFSKGLSILLGLVSAAALQTFSAGFLLSESEDKKVYRQSYDLIMKDFWEDRLELGYKTATLIFKSLNFNFEFFYIFVSFLGMSVIFISGFVAMRRLESPNALLFVLLYYAALFVNLNHITSRTMIALGFTTLFFLARRTLTKLLFALLAVSMHIVSVLPIAVMLINDALLRANGFKLIQKKHIVFIFLSISAVIFLELSLNEYYRLFISLYFDRYIPYINPAERWFDGYTRIPVTQATFLCLAYYYACSQDQWNPEGIRIANLLILCAALTMVLPFPNINSRILIYFLPFFFILFIRCASKYGGFVFPATACLAAPFFYTNFWSVTS